METGSRGLINESQIANMFEHTAKRNKQILLESRVDEKYISA